jgi:DNA-binding LytR/AlgR family response regulator
VKIRCVIADDEPLARDVLRKFAEQHPLLEVAGMARDAGEALSLIRGGDVHLLFLDLHMPGLDGLEFLRSLEHAPAVVITTAHGEHALEGFDLGVADYLLKPIPRERFWKAVDRVAKQLQVSVGTTTPSEQITTDDSYLVLDQGSAVIRIALDDVSHIEAWGNYVKIHAAGEPQVVRQTLSEVEARLPSARFLRVHRSFVIQLSKFTRLQGKSIWLGERKVPLSASQRAELLSRLGID